LPNKIKTCYSTFFTIFSRSNFTEVLLLAKHRISSKYGTSLFFLFVCSCTAHVLSIRYNKICSIAGDFFSSFEKESVPVDWGYYQKDNPYLLVLLIKFLIFNIDIPLPEKKNLKNLGRNGQRVR
jgi:hypothetical protein